MRTNRVDKFRGETITLGTTRAFATCRGIPDWANHVEIEAPSSTIEAITVGFGPRIKRIYFYDASATTWIEYTKEGTDRNTATSIDLSSMQTDDRLYIGMTGPSEGVGLDIDGTNSAGTATSTWEAFLPQAGNVWTDLSATDGTNSTRTLAVDGLVTFTHPVGWRAVTLAETGAPKGQNNTAPPKTERLYWLRQYPSAAITDSSVTVDEVFTLMSDVIALDNDTLTGLDEWRIMSTNGGKPPYTKDIDPDRYGSLELVSASITSAAHINFYRMR